MHYEEKKYYALLKCALDLNKISMLQPAIKNPSVLLGPFNFEFWSGQLLDKQADKHLASSKKAIRIAKDNKATETFFSSRIFCVRQIFLSFTLASKKVKKN